ncbi:MAG: DUF1573 domain-containing protein [Candidatus Eisenbacteria sp.]|nr:DUF1573 domain-containing protein [Candidatus Eisenbacteria bacterium]
MRKTIATIAFVILPAAALAAGVRVAGPVAELDPPIHDFGTITQGVLYRAEVILRNGGTAPLEVRAVTSDCGCTVAELADSLLAPGEATPLRFSFASRSFSGKIEKHLFVETNDPGAPRAILTLKATVRTYLRWEPRALEFGNVPLGQSPRQSVTITSALRDSLEITSIDAPSDLFAAEVRREVIGDSLRHQVEFRLRPTAPPGWFRSHALLRTNHERVRQLQVRLSGQVHAFFRIEPSAISFGQLRQGTARTRELHLIGTGEGRHRVTSVACGDQRLVTAIRTVAEGRRYAVMVTMPETIPIGIVRTELHVATDDPAHPEIVVPVRGRVRPAPATDEAEGQ